MGNKQTYSGLTQDVLEEYVALTYLSKYEILSLYKNFYTLGKKNLDDDFHYRFPCDYIAEQFPNLKYNPFASRIYDVFSSYKDGKFSFEDFLDFHSIMSHNCPDEVKAKWAFKIFDFDNNEKIDEYDIIDSIQLLTGQHEINDDEKMEVAKILLESINIQKTGYINELEFEHAVSKMSDFSQTFSFTI